MVEPFERLRARSSDGFNVAVVKAAMRHLGKPAGPVRAPASEVTAADDVAIAEIVRAWAVAAASPAAELAAAELAAAEPAAVR